MNRFEYIRTSDTKSSVELFLVQVTLHNTLDWSPRDTKGVKSEERDLYWQVHTSTQSWRYRVRYPTVTSRATISGAKNSWVVWNRRRKNRKCCFRGPGKKQTWRGGKGTKQVGWHQKTLEHLVWDSFLQGSPQDAERSAGAVPSACSPRFQQVSQRWAAGAQKNLSGMPGWLA